MVIDGDTSLTLVSLSTVRSDDGRKVAPTLQVETETTNLRAKIEDEKAISFLAALKIPVSFFPHQV